MPLHILNIFGLRWHINVFNQLQTIMTSLKLVMPSKKGSIYGAVRGCTFLAHHGQAVAFSHSRKIGFRGRSHLNDRILGGSQTCKCLLLVGSWEMTSLRGALQKSLWTSEEKSARNAR